MKLGNVVFSIMNWPNTIQYKAEFVLKSSLSRTFILEYSKNTMVLKILINPIACNTCAVYTCQQPDYYLTYLKKVRHLGSPSRLLEYKWALVVLS